MRPSRPRHGGSSRPRHGVIPMREHLEQSNREITLAVMVADLPALAEIDAIAATEGVDIVAVGPSDISRALGVSGTPDHPKLVDVIHRVAEAVQKGGVARLALPMNHAALPRNAAQLRSSGGYTNCAPSPDVRILRLHAKLRSPRPAHVLTDAGRLAGDGAGRGHAGEAASPRQRSGSAGELRATGPRGAMGV